MKTLIITLNTLRRYGIYIIYNFESRANYKEALVAYLSDFKDDLDSDSQRRLDSNPLRILDSKSETTQKIVAGAPKLSDYLDEDSKTHFKELCALLDAVGIAYNINEKLVRGLDYYNKTVFEWVTDELGAQGTVCAGGRYDGLVEQLGGKATTAVGFAMGLERLCLLLEATDNIPKALNTLDVYFIVAGEGEIRQQAMILSERLREAIPSVRLQFH